MVKRKAISWSEEDLGKLKELYGTMPNKELAVILSRDKRTLATKAHFLKLKNRRKYWSEEDISYLKRYHKIYSIKKIASKLSRTYKTVQTMIGELGISSLKTRKDLWTDEEIESLKKWYNYFTAENISQKMGRPVSSIRHKAQRLGLMGKVKLGIVRVKDMPRKNSYLWQTLRDKVNTRDHNKCLICGYDKHISTHHIQQVKHGGSNDPLNLVTLCPNCHREADSGDFSQDYLRGLIVGV